MKRMRYALAAVMAVFSASASAQTLEENVGVAPSGFSDNSVTYRYGPAFREPGVTNSAHANGIDIPKHILTFTHLDGGSVWSNFLNGDLLFSTSRDPANNSRSGAVEFYGLYRGDLSLNQATGTKMFSFGSILQDVSPQVGGDLNTKNTAFAPEKKLLVFGPDLHWNIPGGFLSTAFQFSKEWNNNGITGRSVDFDPAWEFEAVWSFPLDPIVKLPVAFDGFADVVGLRAATASTRRRKWRCWPSPASPWTSAPWLSASRTSSTRSSGTSTSSTSSATTTPGCRARSPTPCSSERATTFDKGYRRVARAAERDPPQGRMVPRGRRRSGNVRPNTTRRTTPDGSFYGMERGSLVPAKLDFGHHAAWQMA